MLAINLAAAIATFTRTATMTVRGDSDDSLCRMLGERIDEASTRCRSRIPSGVALRVEDFESVARRAPVIVLSRLTPADAVEQLKAGNMRFVAGESQCGPYGPRVAEFAADSYPFAVILGCSDARLPIETIFDQGPGNLFVVRVAGNFINLDNLASIEFGVDVKKASVVLVLGHSRCGAVRAALSKELDGTNQRGHIPVLVDAVLPSVQAARGFPGDWLENAVAHNVARNVKAITAESKIISNAVDGGEVQVVGGIYNVSTGWVAFT